MELNYGPEKQLSFLTSNTYNGGGWVQAEVARALRNNVETGVLRVTLNGIREGIYNSLRILMSSSHSFTNFETTIFFRETEFVYLFSCTVNVINSNSWFQKIRAHHILSFTNFQLP